MNLMRVRCGFKTGVAWAVVLGALGLALPVSAVTITRRSGAVLYTDMNKGLYCCYAEYAVSNDTANTTYSNIWVKADTFTGGFVKLGGGDPGLYHLDDLAPGQTKMAFFYLQATNITSVAQSHTIRVYEGYPDAGGTPLANSVYSVVVNNTLENNSSKVSSVTYSPNPPTVGGLVTVTVVGDCGNVQTKDYVDFTPAAFTNWNAAAFELVSVGLSLTNKKGVATNITNYLELPSALSAWAAGNITYAATYQFHALTVTSTNTPVSPITYCSQGQSSTHTLTTSYGSFLPIQTPANTTVLSKQANVTQIYTNETVAYTIVVTNSGPNAVTLDELVDTLPSGMSYVTGSSRFNGAVVLDPAVSNNVLTWSETYVVSSNSSSALVFQAKPGAASYATNSVIGYVGAMSTLIDRTLNTADNAPGTNVVRVLLAPLATADTGSVDEDAVLAVPAPGVLANDSELNGFALTVVGYTQPGHGSVTVGADGSYTYTPAADSFGADSFTYTVTNYNGRTATATVSLTVIPVNDAPSFTAGTNQVVLMNAGARTVAGWATALSKGPVNESDQTLAFHVSNNNTNLFSVQPSISVDGTLTYTPAANASGIATVTVYLQDSGGVANGGVDSSPSITFTIQVTAYSIGNWVFYDTNNDGARDFGENGIGGVQMALFTNNAGLPAGSALMTTVTDAHGDYRFDNLPAGTYIVVADVANSPNLFGFASSFGCSTNMALSGGMHDHGQDTPVSAGTVVNGIASLPVTVGEGLQPTNEVVSNDPGPGTYGPLGDAYDNLVLDFGFTPTYSLGNRVFYDNNHNLYQDTGDEGVPDVPMAAFAADADGQPTGVALASTTTDANGWYRLDGLRAGTYVVVLDRQRATNLTAYTSTIGCSTNMTLEGDLWDHGWYFPQVTVGGITNGYPSSPVTLGMGLQPVGEATNAVAGAHGPLGDAYDNLVLDFAMARSFCIGNRVFADDGSGGGTPNNGIQDGMEPGISNVALRVFAADAYGNPVGNAVVIGESNLNVVVTDANGWFRFFRMTAGTYVVVVDVGLSRNLQGYAYRNGSTQIDPNAVSTSLVGFASSSGSTTNLALSGDRYDHGFDVPVSVGEVAYGIAGPPVTLSEGILPLGEETNGVSGASSHGTGGDANDSLTMDFGFTPTYSLGNRVFLDNGEGGGTTNNAVQDGAEPGIANVTVAVLTNGVTLATAVTDASGYYRFDDLMAGTYTVCLPASNFGITGALNGLIGSFGTNAVDRGDKGVSSGTPSVAGITNAPVTLGTGLQPTNETDLAGGAGANGPNGTAYDNLTVDFGLIETNTLDCGLGSLVWHDANNNGLWESGESGIAGVTVEVWHSDADGNLLGGAAVTSTVTDVGGIYAFYPLAPGMYRVRIPTNNFGSGQALSATNTCSTLQSASDGNVDNNNNGLQAVAGQEVLSPVITLRRAGEAVDGMGPYDESGPGADWDSVLDVNGNMTVDFGFYSPADDQSNLCSLGSLVWEDANNNGIWNSGEPGLAGVSLELYQTNASGLVYWSTTVSAADGTYCFRDLPSGTNWVVRIPATNFVEGGALATCPLSGGTPVNADNQTDNDNNGLQPGGMGTEVWSPVIALSAGTEPTNSLIGEFGVGYARDNTNSVVDANGDMTVGFGFTATYSLGNRVFLDLNNNGSMDGADSGVSGVSVKLFWADVSGSPTGTVLAAANTDAGGYYRFDDLIKGTYVAVVDKADSPNLAWTLSSSGASADTALTGDGKDHGKDTPVSVGGVVGGIAGAAVTLGSGLQPSGEAVGTGAGANGPNGDLSDNLTMDFGFTTTYSIGNKVYRDPDNDGQPDMDHLDDGGMTNVYLYVFAADLSGAPTGTVCGASVTDSNGYYRVDGLVAGTYVVVVDVTNSPVLNGYRNVTGFSSDTAGSGDRHDHGLDIPLGAGSVLPGGIASIPVTVGPGLQPMGGATGPGQGANGPSGDENDNLSIDFGFSPLYSLGNRVFNDANNNGVLDGGESGVAVVAMKLFAADGSGSPTGGVVGATSTDASGYYRFDDLPAGTYVVVVDRANSANLTGYVSSVGASTDMTLAGDLLDHGVDAPLGAGSVVPGGIASAPVAVGENDQLVPLGEATGAGSGANGPNGDDSDNLVVDFGFTAAASVAGGVLVDVNGSGAADAEDTNGVSGVTIRLETATGALVATAVTGTDGAYAFSDVTPGDYVVVELDLPGWLSTADAAGANDNQIALTLASGQHATARDFLDAQAGSIAGRVRVDVNGNGAFDAEDSVGVGGVTVALQTNGVTVATAVTGSDGAYLFANIPPAAYAVVETDLPGWVSKADTQGVNDNSISLALLSAQDVSGNDFLDVQYATVAGAVRVDRNGNGLVDVEDVSGIGGVTVRLLDAVSNVVATTATAGDGSYVFTNLLPGAYTVVETDPASYVSTGDTSAPNDNGVPVTLTSGLVSGGHVFLDAQTGSIGNWVWEDLNGNGLQDAGEPGLSNVVVRLLDANGVELDSAQTGTNGVFGFSNRVPAFYLLKFEAPSGYVATVIHAGTDTAADSDADPYSGYSGLISLQSGQTNLAWDAGFYLPALVKGYVFKDSNADNLRDSGDASLTNVLVRLVVGGVVVASTNTDSTGHYQFADVPAGTVSVLVSRVDATLTGVPVSEDQRRNRALADTEGADAYIAYTVLSGQGVLSERPAETLNFGFTSYPLSTAIDVSAYATADGVVIELWTVNESGYGDIVIYAWIGNAWVEVGRVPSWQVVGEGANHYSVAATGLAEGGAYYFRIVDEAGHEHLSVQPVAVKAIRVEAVRLEMQTLTVTFNTEYGHTYVVDVSTNLADWTAEFVRHPTAGGWSDYTNAPFIAGPGERTEVIVPLNGRARAFFRIKQVGQ